MESLYLSCLLGDTLITGLQYDTSTFGAETAVSLIDGGQNTTLLLEASSLSNQVLIVSTNDLVDRFTTKPPAEESRFSSSSLLLSTNRFPPILSPMAPRIVDNIASTS